MMQTLIEKREAFTQEHAEEPRPRGGRHWGMIRTGEDGPALILLPGTLGRADIFFHQTRALAGRARVVALSYPGSGTLEDWAADVAGFARDEGMENAVLLGSSLGGYVAQRAVAEFPQVFGGLVAANTLASVQGIGTVPPYALDLDAVPIDDLRAGFLNGLAALRDAPGVVGELAALLVREVEGRIPEDEMRARLKALKHALPLPEQSLSPDRIFTVESGDDHLITPEMREAVRAALRPARAFRFETGTHFPYLTHPESYTGMLEEVLGLAAPGAHWPEGALVTPGP
ncbi:alpha/beta fold hydrolase [Marimonas lutisalis]|uniref:alpha/beta fold hydrolase n=1 Tax=Marimonas lutisalis TaxID=2545756 RepID=UPI0010FA5B68|nr:alpha/beta hydrolase [Marimonas lutisalis]